MTETALAMTVLLPLRATFLSAKVAEPILKVTTSVWLDVLSRVRVTRPASRLPALPTTAVSVPS